MALSPRHRSLTMRPFPSRPIGCKPQMAVASDVPHAPTMLAMMRDADVHPPSSSKSTSSDNGTYNHNDSGLRNSSSQVRSCEITRQYAEQCVRCRGLAARVSEHFERLLPGCLGFVTPGRHDRKRTCMCVIAAAPYQRRLPPNPQALPRPMPHHGSHTHRTWRRPRGPPTAPRTSLAQSMPRTTSACSTSRCGRRGGHAGCVCALCVR